MASRIVAIAAVLLLTVTSCEEGNSPEATSSVEADLLTGTWQVAALDGEPILGVRLQAAGQVLGWEPSCAGWARPFKESRQTIRFASNANGLEGKVDQVTTVCTVGYPDVLPRIFRTLPELNSIERTPEGRLRLYGGGHTIIFERPVPRSEMPVPTLQGRWRVSSLNGSQITRGKAPILVADQHSIRWSVECALQSRTYLIENERFRAFKIPPSPPPPPSARFAAKLPCAIGLPPHLEDTLTALDGARRIRKLSEGGVQLEGRSGSVILLPIDEA